MTPRSNLDKLPVAQLFKNFPKFHENPKVHCRDHKSPSLFPIPNETNLQPHIVYKIQFNIILTSTPMFSKWALSFRFP